MRLGKILGRRPPDDACIIDQYIDLARLGLGLIQVPRYRLGDALARGELVEILRDFPPSPSPVYVLYPQSRQLSPRVRVFIDWLSTQFASQNPAGVSG